MLSLQERINEAANNYNKTKDPQYKNLWYKLIKEFADGSNNFRRRTLSINSCHKADDGTYIFIGTSRLHGPMRDTKIKTKRLRRHNKPAHYE